MYINKRYTNTFFSYENSLQKARNDSFTPVTHSGHHYQKWTAQLDLRTCLNCAQNHGRIFDITDASYSQPPLHLNCRCTVDYLDYVTAGDATKDGLQGADFSLKHTGKLPNYYVSETYLNSLGWRKGDRPSKYAPGKMVGGSIYDNDDKKLPDKPGRVWYEADINYTQGRRNLHRVLWSSDGLIFVTYDHYETFYEIF